MKTYLTILAVSVLSAACATTGANVHPIVDMQGRDPVLYAQDLGQCQQYATQAISAAQGAVAGAVVFGLLGALLSPRGYRNDAALRAGVVGGAVGGVRANDSQEMIVKRCLAGRGYNVLN